MADILLTIARSLLLIIIGWMLHWLVADIRQARREPWHRSHLAHDIVILSAILCALVLVLALSIAGII